ncbi:hypothetical protein YSKK_33090 [Halopseudomonas aestusnigri]|nr:hypothetical protein YSKK_33090 [Halopseudomonas aestusnigri]
MPEDKSGALGGKDVPDLKQQLLNMQRHLGLNPNEVRQRLRLLLINDTGFDCLGAHLPTLDHLHAECIEALLQHLEQFDEPARLLSHPGRLTALKGQQQTYFRQLLRGPYDLQYVRLRLLVGLTHERLGVDLKWYLAAFHFYLDFMHRAINRQWRDEPKLAEQLYGSLLKVAFFDLSLTVDTYSSAGKMALQASEDRYARAVQGASDGLWEWHVEDDRLHVSERWLAMLGLDAGRAPRTLVDWAALIPELQRGGFLAAVQSHLDGRQPYLHVECEMRDSWGRLLWVMIRGVAATDLHGEHLLAGSLTDISQRKQTEQELAHMVLHDELTGLPNRQQVSQLLTQALQRQAKPGARHAAVLFIDLDRFKLINDSLGHQVGDQVLIQVAKRIERCLRPGDHLARFGGDEFVVLLDDMAVAGDAEVVAKRIMHALQYPIIAASRRLSVSVSIGVAPLKGHGGQQDVLREADLALYRAKAFGKSQLALYSEALQEEVNQRLNLENALSEALAQRQFELFYQPIVQVSAGRAHAVGVEALLRWRQGARLVSPDEFIPVLEESGEIVEVGEWVLQQACAQVRQWQQQGLSTLRCSVNLSSRQLQEQGFPNRVAQILRETGLPPSSLVLEITESLLMRDVPDTLAALRELESMGVRIALDDFGTGFSSLGYLHRYPLHIIKVDKSFITRAPDDERLKAISRAIIGLGRGLDMDVIAEGIETPEQMDFLHNEGCNFVQGFWFSRPQSALDIYPVLERLSLKPPAVNAADHPAAIVL